MLRILPDQVTPAIRSLFRADEPQARRCFAVLDGLPPPGKIFVDHPSNPQWGVVQEAYDHDVFLSGDIDAAIAAEIFTVLRQESSVLVGMWPDDPRMEFLPPSPSYDGRTLEFYDRPIGEDLDAILRQAPADCTLTRIDRDLILRTEWGPDDVRMIGGIEQWEKYCFGYCLMRGDEILSEATVGPPALGLYEPGVITRAEHRSKGYATLVAARLIQEIEAMGGQTYWNCAKQNAASAMVARKLGYRIEKEYRCMVWGKIETRP